MFLVNPPYFKVSTVQLTCGFVHSAHDSSFHVWLFSYCVVIGFSVVNISQVIG